MADNPKPATDRKDDFDYPRYRYIDGIVDEEKKARIGFMRGEKTTLAFEATVKQWIETGWEFDWLFGELFKTNLDRSYYWSARTAQGYIKDAHAAGTRHRSRDPLGVSGLRDPQR
eukprot:5032782-Prymnesium_polylepis.1